jgi:hypothetical protein
LPGLLGSASLHSAPLLIYCFMSLIYVWIGYMPVLLQLGQICMHRYRIAARSFVGGEGRFYAAAPARATTFRCGRGGPDLAELAVEALLEHNCLAAGQTHRAERQVPVRRRCQCGWRRRLRAVGAPQGLSSPFSPSGTVPPWPPFLLQLVPRHGFLG